MLKKIALASLLVVPMLVAATSYASGKRAPSPGKVIVDQPAPKGMCWPPRTPC